MAQYSNGLEDKLNIPLSSIQTLESRYLRKDDSGKIIETGEDMLHRVAKNVAAADAFYLPEFKGKVKPGIEKEKLYDIIKDHKGIQKREEEFYKIMASLDFLPNSPTLMNAGNTLQQLSACFVLPIEDEIGYEGSEHAIFDALKYTAVVHKTGGGTGFSFGRLRPNGAFIKSTKAYSPGPISFLFTFDAGTGQITQGGKRRGANMGILPIDHPDSLNWIYIKNEPGRIENFNLSVALTDEFMKALENDGYFELKDPRKGIEYTIKNLENGAKQIKYNGGKFQTALGLSKDKKELIDNYTGKIIGKVENDKLYLKAREVFDLISQNSWKTGDPGVIFIDRMNKDNPTPNLGAIESTNPCGEQPLLPYESCNLGSINLANMMKNSEGKSQIDYNKLESIVRTSVRFLDNVVDMNKYPLKKIEELTKLNRKIGLGIMGFHHMLIKLGIDYRSEDAIKIAEDVMKFINEKSKEESMELAKERGAFPNFENSIYKNGKPIRNATTTTIAPTGSIGVIASTSQGIESIFSVAYIRNVKETLGQDLLEIDRIFKEMLQKNGKYNPILIQKLANGEIKLQDFPGISEEQKKLFVTAHEISPKQHIKVQAAFQKYTDNAVSKTINFPKDVTWQDIKDSYLLAYQEGCKGITIYRDKSREEQVITTIEKEKTLDQILEENPTRGRNISNITWLPGATIHAKTGCGSIFVTVNKDGYNVVEAFENMNPAGGCASAQTATSGITISLGLHKNVDPRTYIKHLKAISCPQRNDLLGSMSCSQALATALEESMKIKEFLPKDYDQKFFEAITKYYKSKQKISEEISGKDDNKENGLINNKDGRNLVDAVCPDCGSSLQFGEGCRGGKCSNPICGYSSC
ncbi:MAG: adenosylcobalamin-dependent ribonucleoside-diphosphate reductase [Candidatus Woesearchaeota archaeon]